MFSRLLITTTIIVLSTTHANAHCIPCPREGITVNSFRECECPLSKFFYDKESKKCVTYLECTPPKFRNPLPEIEKLAPAMHDALSKILKNVDPAMTKIPRDIALTINAIKKRIENVKTSLPVLLAPIFGIVALKNGDLFEKCRGNIGCMIRETLKREDNYDYIIPKMKPVFDKIIKIMYGVFDDLKEIAQKSCGKGNKDCPLINHLVKLRDLMPGNLEEVLDIQQIAFQINKYLLKDFKKQISEGKLIDA